MHLPRQQASEWAPGGVLNIQPCKSCDLCLQHNNNFPLQRRQGMGASISGLLGYGYDAGIEREKLAQFL